MWSTKFLFPSEGKFLCGLAICSVLARHTKFIFHEPWRENFVWLYPELCLATVGG